MWTWFIYKIFEVAISNTTLGHSSDQHMAVVLTDTINYDRTFTLHNVKGCIYFRNWGSNGWHSVVKMNGTLSACCKGRKLIRSHCLDGKPIVGDVCENYLADMYTTS
jgi:hypothetical protein